MSPRYVSGAARETQKSLVSDVRLGGVFLPTFDLRCDAKNATQSYRVSAMVNTITLVKALEIGMYPMFV